MTEELFNQAVVQHTAGNLQSAESLYRRVLSIEPNHFGALHYLGVIAHQVGTQDVAHQLITRSLQIRQSSDAWCNLGEVYRVTGNIEQAVECYRNALKLDGKSVAALSNLGLALRQLRRFEESEAFCRRALELNPNYWAAWQNLCNVLGDASKNREAVAAGKRAVDLNPDNATIWDDLATAQVELGDLSSAIKSFERAIALDPNNPSAKQNMAQALMLSGDLARAWPLYEYRWQTPGFPSERRNFTQRQWRGDDLGEAALLVHAEQGFGDTIQFVRYLPMVGRRTKKVIVEVQAELLQIVKRSYESELRAEGVDVRVIAKGEVIPPFAEQVPMLSLPLVFGTTVETIPAEVPYLKVDESRLAYWRDRVASEPKSLKVGIAWAGRPTHTNDHNRSCRLEDFASLARVSNARFYVLQKGPALEQVNRSPDGMQLVNWSEALEDFDDTAALISQLDLVICVDTSLVHLAGALGKEVWVVLPFSCDWRWMKTRESDTPWYPTMKLFRQTEPKTWPAVFERVAEALRKKTTD